MIRAKISKVNENTILLESLTDKCIEKEIYPVGEDGRFGTVVLNTRKTLGITKDALPILKKIHENALCDGGDLGDIDWFKSDDGCWNFSWIGNIKRKISTIDEVYKAGCSSLEPIASGDYILIEA